MIRRYLRLPSAQRALVARTMILVAGIRLSLWMMPFALVQRWLANPRVEGAVPARLVTGVPVERLEWAVRAASRRVPAATCLTQSLALQFLLARSGQPSALRIGVTVTDARGFEAHAWVESAGRTLLDRPEDLARYTPLASWES